MIVLLTLLTACAPKNSGNNTNAARNNNARIVLDGREINVSWSDGDTFSYTVNGNQKNARLNGFNTLESYGPVHRWGSWNKSGLLDIANQATEFVQSDTWECTTMSGGGGYNRELIDCPALRRKLVREGLAHLYYLNNDIPENEVALQRVAIANNKGMWSRGAPEGIITSLHSRTENLDGGAYNRICNVETGRCMKESHSERYDVCQAVSAQGSTMVYVPYENRYENQPDCLR